MSTTRRISHRSLKDETTGSHGIDAESLAGALDGVNANQRIQEERKRQMDSLGRKETKAVFLLRLLVLSILFVSATLVSVGVYFTTVGNETAEFESSFKIHANKIVESFGDAVEGRIGAAATLSNSITNYALSSGSTFPYVTVPNFAVLGSDMRVQAQSFVVHYTPIITDGNRASWEKYAFQNRFQINDAYEQDLKLREDQDAFYGLTGDSAKENSDRRQLQQQQGTDPVETEEDNIIQDGTGYHMRIFLGTGNRTALPEGSGPYSPLWQRSPINDVKQETLNTDFNTQHYGILSNMLEDPKVIFNKIRIPPPLAQSRIQANVAYSQYRDDGYHGEPLTFTGYPVFDSFNQTDRNLVGVLYSNFLWPLYFIDILPPQAKGIICVLENSFNQTLTFQIDGSNATSLGSEDHKHLYSKYAGMEISISLQDYINSISGPKTRAYTTVPLHGSYGLYRLHVYPSQATEDEYRTIKPIVYTLVVAAVFLVTVLVFLLFNYIVERRQRIVLNRAVQSGAIVSSLFPAQIHNRLYNDANDNNNNNQEESNWKTSGRKSEVGINESVHDQIADLYPESTIMFADIVGFTRWSSTRDPKEVFDLLECLYGAFDAVATRRKVFKVETIGDCYLAACGLPDPNPEHALVMCRFARDCITTMSQVVRKICDRLGPETVSLQLRVGLHSGPVTAGVLRGQKSRFQLFGDTVNTASRLESSGQPGRIHISQETADQLKALGKSNWFQTREDKVVAKGKGELQTYWLKFQAESVRTLSSDSADAVKTGSAHVDHVLSEASEPIPEGATE